MAALSKTASRQTPEMIVEVFGEAWPVGMTVVRERTPDCIIRAIRAPSSRVEGHSRTLVPHKTFQSNRQ